MGRLVPKIVPGDWNSVAYAIAKLDSKLNSGAAPTFAGLTLTDLTASRLVATDASKKFESVADLTAWIAGTTDHISVASDGDGTVTVNLDTNTRTLLGSFNGMFLEKLNFTISEAAGTVTGSLEQDGGGDLIQKFSDGYTTLDCTPALTINLTGYVGTNAVPKEVFVYILQSAKTVMAASNSDWPATEHIKIARLILKSAAATGTDGGALGNQNWNDYAFDATSEGHILHVEHRLRQEPAQYTSGVALTLKNSAGAALTTGNSSTAVEIVTAEGKVFQLHKHTFPAFDMYTTATDLADVVNQPTDEGGAYETTADLVTDITHYVDGTAAGVAIGANKYFNLVVWGVQNREGEVSQLMINLPTGQYTTEAAATADIDGTSTFDIPLLFKGTGFLIARLTFRLIAGAQWTYIAQEDLRGRFPGLSAGVGVTTTDHALLANLTFAAAGHTGFQAQGDVLDDLNALAAVADNQFIVGSGAGTFAYESPATVLATLSGQAGTAFAWNSQNLTGVGTIGSGAITSSGASIFNSGSVDADFTVNWNTGVGLFVQGSDGRVGIGTGSPNAPLEVKGAKPAGNVGGFQSGMLHVTGSGTAEFSNSVITGHSAYDTNTQLWYLGSTTDANNDVAFINRQNAAMHFYTNNATRMTIDASGNVTFAIIAAEGSDVDKFLVSSTGVVKYRTGTQVLSDIGGQASDAGLTSLAGLTYAAASFVKMTGANTFALRTIAQTADDLEGAIVHDNLASVHQDVTTTGTPRFNKLGIGVGAPGAPGMLQIQDLTLDTVTGFNGAIDCRVIKTAGATDENDILYGVKFDVDYAQVGGTIGLMTGVYTRIDHTDGDIGTNLDGKDLRSLFIGCGLSGGKVWGEVDSFYMGLNQGAGHEVVGDLNGGFIYVSAGGTVGGTVSLLNIREGVNVDYAIYHSSGTAPSHFGGNVNAVGGFSDNGTPGMDTTFLDQDGNTITVSGGLVTAKTAP